MSLRLVTNIIRKDWFEYRKIIFLLTGSMFVPLLLGGSTRDFSRGMMTGLLISAAYGYAYSCFMTERQQGTLQLLLSLPVRSFDLVLAKYAALYSMVLFTTNVAGPLLRDLRLLFLLNCFTLLLATIAMAATVISDKPWAPMIPLWLALVFFMPIHRILEKFYPDGLEIVAFVSMHITWFGALALIMAPAIAVLSALCFRRIYQD